MSLDNSDAPVGADAMPPRGGSEPMVPSAQPESPKPCGMLEAALALAEIGMPVFPLLPRGKTPATKHGFKNATTNPEIIKLWFTSRSDANLGVATGDIFVLDVDPRHEGDKTLAALEQEHGELPATVRARTGGGGWHLYFRAPGRVVRNKQGFAPGLDVRGHGGYVVVPPSVHESGSPYGWADGCSPHEREVAVASAWLVELIGQPKKQKTSRQKDKSARLLLRRVQAYAASVPGVQEGERNGAAFSLAGHLRAIAENDGEHLDEPTLLRVLQEWNARCAPPLDQAELEKCLESSRINGTPPSPKLPLGSEDRALDGRRRLLLAAGDQHSAADECIRILAIESPPTVFQWCRALVRIVQPVDGQGPEEKRNSARIHPLSEAGLCDHLNQRIQFYYKVRDRQTNELVDVSCDCPVVLARWILARGEWESIAPLMGVVEAPTMLADGRVVTTPGYDTGSGLYFDFEEGRFPPLPERPTKELAEQILKESIAPIFDEFPFATPASRAVHLSAILTAIARPAFPTAPAHAFSAPSMASGKTLLAESVSMSACGHLTPPISQAESEEETEKRFHSALLDGRRIGFIDNVTQPLEGDVLCSAITGTSVSIRPFRTQQLVRVPTWNMIWLATGNNLEFGKDMRSRALLCRLDPMDEHPEQRTFRISNLLQHLKERRPQLVIDALTVVLAYHQAGRPDVGLKPLNRFDGWSGLIRSALVWLGMADPVETMVALSRSDSETQALMELLHALRDQFKDGEFTAAAAVYQASDALKNALDLVCRDRGGESHDPRRLGRFLQRSLERVVDGLRFEIASNAKGTNRYRVIRIEGGSGGRGGGVPAESRIRAGAHHAHACAHVELNLPPRSIAQTPPLPPLPPDGEPGDGGFEGPEQGGVHFA